MHLQVDRHQSKHCCCVSNNIIILLTVIHRNISLPNMEGGAMISEVVDVHEGKFSVQLQASEGHNTILSVTFSEGELDDYTRYLSINWYF